MDSEPETHIPDEVVEPYVEDYNVSMEEVREAISFALTQLEARADEIHEKALTVPSEPGGVLLLGVMDDGTHVYDFGNIPKFYEILGWDRDEPNEVYVPNDPDAEHDEVIAAVVNSFDNYCGVFGNHPVVVPISGDCLS